MNTRPLRSAFACTTVLSLAGAFAQNAHGISVLDWTEVIAGTTTPVASPNGALEPGEAARIDLSLSFTPLVGMPVMYHSPPPGGVAPVAGLYVALFSLYTTTAQGGTWSHLAIAHGFQGELGYVTPEGSLGTAAVSHPFPLPPGVFPITTNPLPDMWSAVWTPPAYNPRLVAFELLHGLYPFTLWVHTGFDPSGNPTFGFAEATGNHGFVINIPVAPAPASGAVVLGLGVAAAKRRR